MNSVAKRFECLNAFAASYPPREVALTIGRVTRYPVLMETNGQDEPFAINVRLTPWQRRLFLLTHTRGVFEVLAWLDCSVPGFRGHLGRLLRPNMKRRTPPK